MMGINGNGSTFGSLMRVDGGDGGAYVEDSGGRYFGGPYKGGQYASALITLPANVAPKAIYKLPCKGNLRAAPGTNDNRVIQDQIPSLAINPFDPRIFLIAGGGVRRSSPNVYYCGIEEDTENVGGSPGLFFENNPSSPITTQKGKMAGCGGGGKLMLYGSSSTYSNIKNLSPGADGACYIYGRRI